MDGTSCAVAVRFPLFPAAASPLYRPFSNNLSDRQLPDGGGHSLID